MIDPQTRARLQEIIRRENLSLLAYVRQAYPWTSRTDGDDLARVQAMLDDEQRELAALGQHLTRHHVPLATHGSFPSDFPTSNFVALKHLIPRLVEAERRTIADLERDLPAIAHPECKARLEEILDAKRRHLAEMEHLQAPQPAGA